MEFLKLLLSLKLFIGLTAAYYETGNQTWTFVSRPDLTPQKINYIIYDEAAVCHEESHLVLDPILQDSSLANNLSLQNVPVIYDLSGNMVYSAQGQSLFSTRDASIDSVSTGQQLSFWNGHQSISGYVQILNESYASIGVASTGDTLARVPVTFGQRLPTGRGTITFFKNLGKTGLILVSLLAPKIDRSGSEVYVLDNVLQEIDLTTRAVLFQWSAAKHVDIEESFTATGNGSDISPFNYFDATSADKDSDGMYLISASGTSTIYFVPGDTNESSIYRRVGGKNSDVDFKDFGFSFQHDAQIISKEGKTYEIALFNNAWNGSILTNGQHANLSSEPTTVPPVMTIGSEVYTEQVPSSGQPYFVVGTTTGAQTLTRGGTVTIPPTSGSEIYTVELLSQPHATPTTNIAVPLSEVAIINGHTTTLTATIQQPTIAPDELIPTRGSSGKLISVDLNSNTASLIQSFYAPQDGGLLSPDYGSIQRLCNGNYFIGWGALPFFSEFLPNGSCVMHAQYGQLDSTSWDRTVYSTRVRRGAWSAKMPLVDDPTETPVDGTSKPFVAGVVKQDKNGKEHTTCYASWNGATADMVSSWRFFASLGDAKPIKVSKVVSRNGRFETSWTFPGRYGECKIQALNSRGENVGESRSALICERSKGTTHGCTPKLKPGFTGP